MMNDENVELLFLKEPLNFTANDEVSRSRLKSNTICLYAVNDLNAKYTDPVGIDTDINITNEILQIECNDHRRILHTCLERISDTSIMNLS